MAGRCKTNPTCAGPSLCPCAGSHGGVAGGRCVGGVLPCSRFRGWFRGGGVPGRTCLQQ